MVPRKNLIFFVLLYVCFISPVHSKHVFSWPYYKGFVADWTLKPGSTAVKTAAKPSGADPALTPLDTGFTGDVWGLWGYTVAGRLSYKFNLAQYDSFFCGITSASLRIKYYSETGNTGKVLHCTGTSCDLPAQASIEWGEEIRPVQISDKILEFEFHTEAGKTLMIDEVSMIYDKNPNDPACKDPPPPPPPNKLQQLLNQFKQDFKQIFSFFNIFG